MTTNLQESNYYKRSILNLTEHGWTGRNFELQYMTSRKLCYPITLSTSGSTTACKRRGSGGGQHASSSTGRGGSVHAASWRSASYRRGSRGHCANRRSEVWACRPRCICTGVRNKSRNKFEWLTYCIVLFFTDLYKGSVFTSSFGHDVAQYYKPQSQLAAWIDFHDIWNEGTTYRAIVY